jgi:TP901 family phage tail tape measure protein
MADENIVTNIVANADFSDLIANVNKVTTNLAQLKQTLVSTDKALALQAAKIQQNFASTLRSTGQFSTHFVSLSSDVEKFGKNLDSGKLKLRDYYSTWQNHQRTAGGLIRDLAKQQVQLQNSILQPLGRNAEGLMQFNVQVPRGLDLTKNKASLLKQEMQIMNKVIQDGGVQLINWGKNTQWAGRQLTVGLTLPLAAFGKAAADAFKVADQELVRLTKVYGGVAQTSAVELAKVRKEVAQTAKELAQAYGSSYTETISLAADIAATGKQGEDLIKSTQETTRLAVLGEVDRQEAMKATLSIQTAFKQNTEQLTESINFLNAVENQTSTSLADLVEAIPKAGPIIQSLGGTIEDLALYLTAMKEGGVNASEGANAIKSSLASLINPTKVAKEQFLGFGISLEDIVNSNAGNLTAMMLDLQASLDKLDPLQKSRAIEQLFGKFQFARMSALFENLGKQGSQTLQVLDLMKASSQDLANVAGRELAQITESASGKYRRALEGLKADLAGVGESFLNIQTALIGVIDKVIDFGAKLPDPIKKILTLVGGLTALAGPAIMLTGVLANFFGYIIKGVAHFKALFKGGEGWKLLTPEILAAQKAGNLMEATFYSDAKAANILGQALANLNIELDELSRKASSGTISAQPVISTVAGSAINMGEREVISTHPLLSPRDTRSFSHLNPVSRMTDEQKAAQTIFGVVPGAPLVNQKISNNPQMYMSGDMPKVEGLTSIRGVSTGVVAGEAAKFHSMTGALGMQSQQELELLKREVAATGLITQSLSESYQALLPEMTQLTTMAAAESAEIVAELQARKITMDQARAKIAALNANVEAMMGEVATSVAATQGRAINLTQLPLVNQPAFDPITGKANMKELTRPRNRTLLNKIAGVLGVKTFGAPYSIETTRPKRFNMGGKVFFNNGDQVPGFGNTDTVPAMLTPGEFVIKKDVAQQDPNGMRALNDGQAMVVPVQKRNKGGLIINPNKLQKSHITTDLSGLMLYLPDFLNKKVNASGNGATGREIAQVLKSMQDQGYNPNSLILGSTEKLGGDVAQASRRTQEALSQAITKFEKVYPDQVFGGKKDPGSFERFMNSIYKPATRGIKIDSSRSGGRSNLFSALSQMFSVRAEGKISQEDAITRGLIGSLKDGETPSSGMGQMIKRKSGRLSWQPEAKTIGMNVPSWAKGFATLATTYSGGGSKWRNALLNRYKFNEGGMIPTMGGAVTPQGGRSIPVPAQSGKYNMGGMVQGYVMGGSIPSLAASKIAKLTAKWKPQQQFRQPGYQYTLGNQDPLHGPLQIGTTMVPKNMQNEYEWMRETLYRDDRFARQAVLPQFPIGTMEERGKYILRQYMAGNYGILNTPGATEAVKSLSKKFSGTLYRGIFLKNNRTNPLPQNILDMVSQAKLTGDYSGLIGKEFIMRRSSWSQDREVASLFAPGHSAASDQKAILLEAVVKNRNVVPASNLFPDAKFSAPFGQKVTGHNSRSEQESIFGGKFKIVDAGSGKLKLETVVDGARAMGGPVNSGRPYLVGENGPEIFVPRNSGGIIPGYQEGGAVGAFTAGLRNPYGKGIASSMAGKQMGFGAQMGLGMAGGIAGQMVGGNAGMAIMMASNILPMMTALKGFGGLIPSVTKVAGILGRLTIPGAVIGGLTAAVMLVNKFRRDAENAGEVNRAMFGGTKDQLAEVGISYTSISERIKDMNTQLELNKAKIESSYNSFTKSGIPGLTLTIQQLKDGIEKAKTSAKETVDLFNNADTAQVNELATSIKAQYVAMGMSVEEATNTIYTLVAASNKSKQALGAISSSGFKDIVDQASAATSQVQKLGKVIEGSLKFNAEEFNTGMDSVLNSLNAYKNSLVGAKDSSGKIKTETEALAETIEKIKGTTGATSTINNQNLEAYKLQNLEMASILGKSESILSIFSKYQLVAAGLSDVMDISAMSGAQAISVAAGYQKVKDAASAVVAETTIGKLVASRLKNQRNLQGLIKNSASQDSSYYNNAIKQKQKLIEILEEERKKRLAILDIQEQSQSFETAIKQTQIKYQEALASGNMAQAAQEQLNIQKLRADRERELARKSINDKFDAERKKLEDEIERLQNQKDAKDKAASNAVASSQRATEDLQAAKDFEAKIVGIVSKYGGKFSADAQKALAVAFNDAKASKDAGLAAAATQMEKQYITGSRTYQSSPGIAPVTVTKDKYQSMFENLSIETLAKAGSNDKFSKAVESFVSAVNVFAGKEKPVVTTGRTTGQNRFSEAVDVMAPKGGTIEKIGGITYIYDNMGKRYDITTPAGIKLRAVFKKAMGGYISGAGNGTSDSIPAMLSNGEYVINAKSVQAAGIPMLDRINKMAMGGPVYNIPAYSMGGRVKYNAGGLANSSNSLYNINVTLNGTDLSADDVANAIERKMRIREATIGRGRNN